MESHISSTLVFLPTASCGVRLWRCILVLIISVAHMIYMGQFFLSLGDRSLEEYYAKFHGTYEELNICEPLSIDIQVMKTCRFSVSIQLTCIL